MLRPMPKQTCFLEDSKQQIPYSTHLQSVFTISFWTLKLYGKCESKQQG